jgi:glycosyltransferase involved in cell wall biosynthesis
LKILFLSKSPDATEFYRCEIPQKYLELSGHEVRRCYLEKQPKLAGSGIQTADVEWAEVIVFQRPLTRFALNCLQQIRTRYPAKVLVGDYDDDYYSVPDWNPGFTFVKAHEPVWTRMPALYDGIVASTLPLKEKLETKTQTPIEVIANGFDFELFDSLEPCQPFYVQATTLGKDGNAEHVYPITNEQFNELMRDRTVVAWAGSRFHYVDLDYLSSAVAEVCRVNPDIVFLFVGYIQGNVLKGVPVSRLFTVGGRYPTHEFYRLLKSLKIDIMLAPLDPCEFNQSKSAIKIYEAMAIGAYPICSEFDPYEDELDPEALLWEGEVYRDRYGTLVPYQNRAWSKAILQAASDLKDPIVADSWRTANHSYVRERHHASARSELYIKFFTRLLNAKLSVRKSTDV